MKYETYRGMQLWMWTNTDRRGRTMYYVTVDGETVGRGYSEDQALWRAKKRLA